MKQFIKQHKYHLIILIILLIITGISGYQYSKIYNLKFKISKESIINDEIQNIDKQETNNNQHITGKNEQTPNNNYQITNQEIILTSTTGNINSNLNTTTEDLQLTTYELKANNYDLTPTSTVYNLMQLASADSRVPFLFETKNYGSMGLFVESINGLKNNNKTGKYWIYYVNNESAQIGISNYIIKPNDIITWKYETSTF